MCFQTDFTESNIKASSYFMGKHITKGDSDGKSDAVH